MFRSEFEEHFFRVIRKLSIEKKKSLVGKYVHLLDFDPLFKDFIRLGLGIPKITSEDAHSLLQALGDDVEYMKEKITGQ